MKEPIGILYKLIIRTRKFQRVSDDVYLKFKSRAKLVRFVMRFTYYSFGILYCTTIVLCNIAY